MEEMMEMGDTGLNTSLLNQSVDGDGNPSGAAAMKKKLGLSLLAKFKKAKTIEKESIYNCNERKVKQFKLTNDSNAMGFAVYLKKEYLQMDFSDPQRSDVLMNSVIVQLVQIMMILCIWKYAATNEGFAIRPVKTLDMMIARFLASAFMHINVEKDVR